jgi:hypothetical protein
MTQLGHYATFVSNTGNELYCASHIHRPFLVFYNAVLRTYGFTIVYA